MVVLSSLNPTVIWVDQANSIDTNDGHRIIDAMKTIKAAVASANDGDIILIAPGVYREVAPIDITVNNLSVVGQSLRSVLFTTPQTETNTLSGQFRNTSLEYDALVFKLLVLVVVIFMIMTTLTVFLPHKVGLLSSIRTQ